MSDTFRNINDSKEFFIGLIGGLVVAIVSVALEFFNRMWNPENKPNFVYWIMIFFLLIVLIWALCRWSHLRDVQDDIDAGELKRKHKK